MATVDTRVAAVVRRFDDLRRTDLAFAGVERDR